MNEIHIGKFGSHYYKARSAPSLNIGSSIILKCNDASYTEVVSWAPLHWFNGTVGINIPNHFLYKENILLPKKNI